MERDIATSVKRHPLPHGDTWRRLRHLVPTSFAVAVVLLIGSGDAWARANVAPPARAGATAPADPSGERSATSGGAAPAFEGDYANREARTPGLERFEGGDIVIIGSTGLVLLLVIILLILLL